MKQLSHLLMITLLTFFMVACGDSIDTPKGTAKAFFTSIEEGDIDTMISLIDFGGQVSDEEMEFIKPKFKEISKELGAEFKKQGGVKAIKFNETTYSDDKTKAKVNITFKDEDGESMSEEVPLVKVDGQWKIADF